MLMKTYFFKGSISTSLENAQNVQTTHFNNLATAYTTDIQSETLQYSVTFPLLHLRSCGNI